MLGELVPCAGGPPITLRKPRLVLGRHPDCDVPIHFASVSARHCELELEGGWWRVRDLQSRNGTRINGTMCEAKWLLPNDVLELAKCRFTIRYTPPAGKPPSEAQAPPAPRGAATVAPAEAPLPVRLNLHGPSRLGLGDLVPCGGGEPIPLVKTTLVIGRLATCDIVLRSPSVSGRHCQLDWAADGWMVRDLGSRNGIRVDDEPCQERRLNPGSVLQITSHRFQIVYRRPGAGGTVSDRRMFAQSLLEAAGLVHWQPPPSKKQHEDEPERRRLKLDDV